MASALRCPCGAMRTGEINKIRSTSKMLIETLGSVSGVGF